MTFLICCLTFSGLLESGPDYVFMEGDLAKIFK